MLKSYRVVGWWGGGVVAHVILVLAQVLWVFTLGLWTLGLGLDNSLADNIGSDTQSLHPI